MLTIKQDDGHDLVQFSTAYQAGSNIVLVFHTKDKYCYMWDCYRMNGQSTLVFQNLNYDRDFEYQIFIDVELPEGFGTVDAVHFIPLKYEYRVILIPNIFLPSFDDYDILDVTIENSDGGVHCGQT